MFRLDPKPFQAQVDALRAEVEIRRAQLWTAQANLDRITPLAAQDAAGKSDLDNAIGSVKTAEAALTESQARLQRAELDLGYATIKAPVTGISSQSLMREGAYVAATGPSASLTYVAKLDPIWVEFSVSQNEMARSVREVERGLLTVPDDQNYQVEVELSDGSRYTHRGKNNFADPSFSQQTGTFLVCPRGQAMFAGQPPERRRPRETSDSLTGSIRPPYNGFHVDRCTAQGGDLV